MRISQSPPFLHRRLGLTLTIPETYRYTSVLHSLKRHNASTNSQPIQPRPFALFIHSPGTAPLDFLLSAAAREYRCAPLYLRILSARPEQLMHLTPERVTI